MCRFTGLIYILEHGSLYRENQSKIQLQARSWRTSHSEPHAHHIHHCSVVIGVCTTPVIQKAGATVRPLLCRRKAIIKNQTSSDGHKSQEIAVIFYVCFGFPQGLPCKVAIMVYIIIIIFVNSIACLPQCTPRRGDRPRLAVIRATTPSSGSCFRVVPRIQYAMIHRKGRAVRRAVHTGLRNRSHNTCGGWWGTGALCHGSVYIYVFRKGTRRQRT